MDQEPKGRARGRSRGRARGSVPPTTPGPSAGVGAAAPPQHSTTSTRAHFRGAERPGGLQERQGASAVEHLAGRFESAVRLEEGSSNGNGNGGVGRGVMRGRREISQILWTKPDQIETKQGTMGTSIPLLVNYYELHKKTDWLLCLYHVDFSPEEDRTGERKKLVRQHNNVLGDSYLFDGMQLFTSRKITHDAIELSSKRDDGATYQIKIKFIKELKHLDPQFLQILNILLNRCQDHLGLQFMGRNFYNPNQEIIDRQYKIRIWPGFASSIKQHEDSILMNVDVCHKFLRDDTMYDAFKNLGQDVRRTAADKFLGTIVMTKYNNKTYRVDDIDFTVTPNDTFELKGKKMSYMQYYKEKYGMVIKDPRQPMLMSKPKKRDIRRGMVTNIYLVPELCIITGLADEMRNDFNAMKNFAQYMRMVPDKRVASLRQFNMELNRNPKVKEELQKWGLTLSSDMLKLTGRVLPEEPISQGGQNFSYQRSTSDWSREMRNLRLNTAVNLVNWICVYPSKFSNDAKDLVQTLVKVGGPMGMQINQPEFYALRGDSASEYIQNLGAASGKQMALVLLPNNRGDRYGAIKKHLSVNLGVPSQCCLTRTIFKKQRLMSVATKIAIQMNCKLGGEVWNLSIPIKNVMVVGYDTYHDSIRRGDSFGAVVASINATWTRYVGQVSRHSNKEELTNNFGTAMRCALQAYKDVNKTIPTTIIVFRDGVGDGQISYVKEHEVAHIKQTFKGILEPGQAEPKLVFIIVSKRINTRIFDNAQNRPNNPPAGTVVDNVITLPERYDFFLISQSVNQGTVSPTSYNVIEDSSKYKPDHIQRIAYKLTHLYYNWQGTVRVPAPCLYAHKLAFITGQSVHEPAHRQLIDKLWFL